MKRWMVWTLSLGLGSVGLLQVLPVGGARTNPPVRQEPAWDAPRTRDLAVRACFDCHSNETKWPWYSHVAPISWAVINHVDEGRAALNFSEWDKPQGEADEAASYAARRLMPLPTYLLAHSEARLTDDELRQLVSGLEATLGGKREEKHDERGEGHEHR